MPDLYVVATPIGNLSDLSPRAIAILSECDFVIAEDTRHTLPLLTHFGIRKPLVSCHKFNERDQVERIITRLQESGIAALVSDAGTPAISDPGYLLVAAAWNAGITVRGVAGPSAVVTALSVSGFNADRFTFYGFAPRAEKGRKALWQAMGSSGIPVAVLYESPKRIVDLCTSLAAAVPQALCCVCCDLTKRFEHSVRGTVTEVLQALTSNPNAALGEYVLVVALGEKAPAEGESPPLSLEAQLVDYMNAHACSLKDAQVGLTALGMKKNALYQAALHIKTMFA